MGWFDFLNDKNDEQRAFPTSTGTSFAAAFEDKEQESDRNLNRNITEQDAMSIPTVQACVNLICGTIGQLNVNLYKKDEQGNVSEVTSKDIRVSKINDEPNDFINGYNFKYNICKDYLLHGSNYTYMNYNKNGELEGLYPLSRTGVSIQKYRKRNSAVITDAEISYNDPEGSATMKKKYYDFIITLNDSKNGLEGIGILEKGRPILNLALAQMAYSKSVYENGALPLGVLKTANRLSEPAIKKLRESWSNLYQGLKNSNKTIILEEGLDYSPLSLKPTDLQLGDSRSYITSEVCRLFNIPESLINANVSKYGNIEQNNIHFLQYCISPILKALEKSINKALLTENEKNENYFFAFDESGILRTTEQEKMSALKVALDCGIYSLNEARSKVNMTKLDKDLMRFSLGNVFYDRDNSDVIIPNMGTIINLESKEFMKLGETGVPVDAQEQNEKQAKPDTDKNTEE